MSASILLDVTIYSKSRISRHEPLRLSVMAAVKVRAHAVFQHLGLADINDGAFVILHQITARLIRQQRQLVANPFFRETPVGGRLVCLVFPILVLLPDFR